PLLYPLSLPDALPISIALAARERADLTLLIAAAEVEPRDVGARVDRALAELNLVVAARDLVEHGAMGRQRLARLVNIADLHGLADRKSTRLNSSHVKI